MTVDLAVTPNAAAAQAEVVEFLERSDVISGNDHHRRIDTHCATVFLSGDRAWKLKRAVRFAYLDYSTPPLRHDALVEELRLNNQTAPGIYVGIHAVTRDEVGVMAIDGAGDPLDWLLEMHRFPDDALLSAIADAGELDDPLLGRLADQITAFHAASPTAAGKDGAGRIDRVINGSIENLLLFPALFAPDAVHDLAARLREASSALGLSMDLRARSGRVRHVHGDLHLANIVILDGEPVLFDRLEFSVELATTDVLYDLAFLLMDLWQRGLRHEANLVFNRYIDSNPIDEVGTPLMAFFIAIRATVRAHVLAAQIERGNPGGKLNSKAQHFFKVAIDVLAAASARLVAIGGLSGTGKSSIARAIGGDVGRAPGARILRTDVLRKQHAGINLETPLPAASYTSEASALVYTQLDAAAAAALASGQAVIADGVFVRRAERDAIEDVAKSQTVPFTGVWLEAAERVRKERVLGRHGDASDADVEVIDRQSRASTGPLLDWQTLNAEAAVAQVADQARAHLEK